MRIHQVIGWKVVKILKSELTFSLIDKIDTKFSTYKTGENLTNWSLSGLNTHPPVITSDTLNEI